MNLHQVDVDKLDAIIKAERFNNDNDSDSDDTFEDIESSTNVKRNIPEFHFDEFMPYDVQLESILESTAGYDVNRVLLLNKTQQALLIEAISRYQKLLEECNQKLNDINRRRLEFKKSCELFKPYRYLRCGVPYFKTKRNFTCPGNGDVQLKRLRGEMSFVDVPPTKLWLDKEKLLLKRLVCEQSKKIRIVQIEQKIRKNCDNSELLKEELDDWKRRRPEECVYPVDDKSIQIDWETISFDELKGRHTPDSCKAMWYMFLHPHLNIKSYGPSEFERLKEIVAKHNEQDWEAIAQELGTQRSSYHCCVYYNLNRVDDHRKREQWTQNEDAYLLEVIDKSRLGEFIPWSKVSYYIPGRKKSQIYSRYMNSLQEGIRKGKFDEEEDLLILAAVKKYGENFPKISTILSGRTTTQIRERYINYLQHQGIKNTSWTADEDRQIIEHVKDYGTSNWSQLYKKFISNNFRSRTVLRHRWKVLKKYNCDLERVPRMRKRSAYTKYDPKKLQYVFDYINRMDDRDCLSNISFDFLTNGTDEKFVHLFITTFHNINDDHVSEIDVINALYVVQLINGRLNLDKRKHIFKKLDRIVVNYLESFVNNEINRSNDNLICIFETYWMKYYLKKFFDVKSDQCDLSSLFPIEFTSYKLFKALLLGLKSVVKFTNFDNPSCLDMFYEKKKSNRFGLKNQIDRSHLEQQAGDEIKINLHTQTFNDFNISLSETQNSRKRVEQLKCRMLALFNLPPMHFVRNRIIEQIECQSDSSVTVPIKNEIVVPVETITKKRGRPRKILPGKRFKHPRPTDNIDVKINVETN